MILESLRHEPVKPSEWRAGVKKLLETRQLTKEEFAKKVDWTIEELEDKLREDLPERDRLQYAKGLKKCVASNSRWSITEIAKVLHVSPEWLIQEIDFASSQD